MTFDENGAVEPAMNGDGRPPISPNSLSLSQHGGGSGHNPRSSGVGSPRIPTKSHSPARKSGLGRGLRAALPRRTKSTDGSVVPQKKQQPPRRLLSGLRGGKPQQQQAPPTMVPPIMMHAEVAPAATATNATNNISTDPQDGKNRSRARASVPGVVGVGSAAEPSLTATSSHSAHNRSLSGDSQHGKMRGRARATAPGAVSSESTSMERSLTSSTHGTAALNRQASVESNDGKIRGRARATKPGAVSEVATQSAEPSLGASLHGAAAFSRQASGDSTATDGKDRGRSRAAKPGAVSEAASPEPTLRASVHGTTTLDRQASGDSAATDGKIRGRARATKPGAVSEAAASAEPSSRASVIGAALKAPSSPKPPAFGRAPGDGKIRGRARASMPGAVSEVGTPSSAEPSPRASVQGGAEPSFKAPASPKPPAPGDGKIRGRTRASMPGAVSEVGTPSAEPSLGASAHKSSLANDGVPSAEPSLSGGGEKLPVAGDGKIRGRARATTPGAVSEAASADEPMAATSGHHRSMSGDSAHSGKIRRAPAAQPGAVSEASGSTPRSVSPSLGGSAHTKRFRRSTSKDSTDMSLLGGSAHARGLRRAGSKDSTDGALAGGFSHSRGLKRPSTVDAVAGGSAHGRGLRRSASSDSTDLPLNGGSSHNRGLRRPTTSEPKADTDRTESDQGSPGGSDPQSIRRKQIQDIMKDAGLTQREKQVKMQELMAGGMPKPTTLSVASTKDLSESSLDSPTPLSLAATDSDEIAPPSQSAEETDPESIRRKQIQDIMRDPNMTQREKQVKSQELMMSGMPIVPPTGAPEVQMYREESVVSPSSVDSATDAESIRRKQIQDIMRDQSLTPREKQVKTQELMMSGMPKVPADAGSLRASQGTTTASGSSSDTGYGDQEETTENDTPNDATNPNQTGRRPPRSRNGSPVSSNRRGLRRNRTFDSEGSAHSTGLRRMRSFDSDGSTHSAGLRRPRGIEGEGSTHSAGLRRMRTNDGPSSPKPTGLGLRRTLSGDGSASPRRNSPRRSRSKDGSPPAGLGGAMPVPGSDLGQELEPRGVASKSSHVGNVTDHSLNGFSVHSIVSEGSFHHSEHDSGVISVPMPDESASSQRSSGGGAASRIGRRDRIAISKALNEVEAEEETPPVPSGVGGAPQGKMRRMTPATRPGASSVPGPAEGQSTTNGAVTGVGGAPQGKIGRASTTPATKPGAVAMVEPASEPISASATRSGVGGAPQGKMRRATSALAPTSKPGAVSVVDVSASAPTEPGTGVGGAPQGKMRRTTVGVSARPGAVSVESPPAMAEPKEPSPTGVGGAPQGKIRRATTSEPRPGAERIQNSVPSPVEPGAAAGVGGAPQGKFRRAATSPASRPGAVSVVEPSSTPAEPGVVSGVGGAPQGKVRRAGTTTSLSKPGATSVVEPAASPTEPDGTSGVGGAPQGKLRRTTATATTPGAVSMVEPSTSPSEPGATKGVGGAPQGKFRRAATTPAPRPGAVSVAETAAPTEPGAATGVGGAPQGKFRRATTAPVAPSEPNGATIEVSSSIQEPSVAPAGSVRHLIAVPKEPRALVPAVSVRAMQTSGQGSTPNSVVSSIESDMLSKSSVRKSRPASLVPGAQSVSALPAGEGDAEEDRTDEIMSTIERDMMSKSNARSSRKISAVGVTPGAQTVSSTGACEPGADASEGEMLSKARARASMDRGLSRSQLGRSSQTSLDMSEASMSSRGLSHNSAPSVRGLSSVTPSSRGLGNSAPRMSTRGLGSRNYTGRMSAQSVGRSSFHSSMSELSDGTMLDVDATTRRLNNQAQAGQGLLAMSQSSFSPSEIDPNEDSDFNHAISLVESDLQVKMNLRAAAGDIPAVPGAQQAEGGARGKDPRASLTGSEDPEDPAYEEDPHDVIDEKREEIIKVGAQSGNDGHTTVQDRMEQKILQMEQEQQARDAKLEELEEINSRRNGADRRKVSPSPRAAVPEVADEISEEIENRFLNPDPEAVRQAEEDGLAIAIAVEDEEPDVYDVELKMYDPAAKPPFYKNRRFRCYSVLICLITVAAIITASVLSAKKGGEIILITQAPSASPSQAPTTARDTAVRGELARVIGDVVNDPDSPHELALEWILYDDPMELDEFSENLIQRYTMALFYYQTSQQGPWISCNPPTGDENYTCPYYEHTRNIKESGNEEIWAKRNDTSVRWLSERHECEWAEVLCHPEANGNVIGIDILGQNLTGTLPDELRHLDNLMWLSLSFNDFTGTIPAVYGELPYMTIFEVNECLLDGSIPPGFYRQPRLLQLNVNNNPLTGTIPPEIGDLTTLHSLFFFNTEVSGAIPTEIGRLEDARNLWLYDNSLLTGTIPSEIGRLTLLETLKLAGNDHIGPIPSEMGLMTNTKEFLFSGNDMLGTTIPEELWNITKLEWFDINGAGFGGTLSTRIGQVTGLKGLKASRNFFSGTVPTEIGLLDDLLLLWVHFNENLGGEIPIDICYLRGQGEEDLIFLNADCGGSPPRISCLQGCCTGCCDEYGQCQVM